MRKKEISLEFPIGGLDKNLSVQKQPPYTSYDLLNVRAKDTISERLRGGSRSGLKKYSETGLGNKIVSISSLKYVDDSERLYDDFNGSIINAALWSCSSTGYTITNNTVKTKSMFVLNKDNWKYNDKQKNFRMSMKVSKDTTYSNDFTFYAYRNDEHDKQLIISFALTNTTYLITFYDAVLGGGALATYSGAFTPDVSGYDILAIELVPDLSSNPRAVINLYINNVSKGTVALSILTNLYNAAKSFINFAFAANMYTTTPTANYAQIHEVIAENISGVAQSKVNDRVVAISNGYLYMEDEEKIMQAVSGDIFDDELIIQMQDRGQKLYVADNGIVAEGSFSSSTTTLTSSSVSDFTAIGIATDVHVIELYDVSVGLTEGVYKITTINSGSLVLSSSPGTSGTGSFRIYRCPKVYDPKTNDFDLWVATSGNMPSNAGLMCLYRDRFVMAKDNAWYMSRQGDPLDWDYSLDLNDYQRAVAGSSEDAGLIGDNIAALIPHSDDYLVFGCLNSMWMLKGDPTYGGMIDNISRNIGILSANAWCRGMYGEIYFLSKYGLYQMNIGSAPVPLSPNKLPQELLNINTNDNHISLGYSREENGVYIFVKSLIGERIYQYFFDIDNQSFWKDKYPIYQEPYVVCDVNDGLLIGSFDGYIRIHDKDTQNDDGINFDSYVYFGVLNMSSGMYDGFISEITANVGMNSGEIDLYVLVADTPDFIRTAPETYVCSLCQGLNYNNFINLRGAVAAVKLQCTNGERWAFENISLSIKDGGRKRLS